MRKVLTILVGILIILAALGEVVLPQIAQGALQRLAARQVATNDVQVSLDASPRILVCLGRIGSLHAIAHNGQVGEVQVSELALDGENVAIDMPALVSEERLLLQSAEKLELRGIVTADNLRELLSRKVERLENLEVTITPEEVKAVANMKIMGRMADVELTGLVIADGGDLYFRMSHLNVRNTLFRTFQMENFFGDIQLTKPDALPLGLRFEDVRMLDGRAAVTARRLDMGRER